MSKILEVPAGAKPARQTLRRHELAGQISALEAAKSALLISPHSHHPLAGDIHIEHVEAARRIALLIVELEAELSQRLQGEWEGE